MMIIDCDDYDDYADYDDNLSSEPLRLSCKSNEDSLHVIRQARDHLHWHLKIIIKFTWSLFGSFIWSGTSHGMWYKNGDNLHRYLKNILMYCLIDHLYPHSHHQDHLAGGLPDSPLLNHSHQVIAGPRQLLHLKEGTMLTIKKPKMTMWIRLMMKLTTKMSDEGAFTSTSRLCESIQTNSSADVTWKDTRMVGRSISFSLWMPSLRQSLGLTQNHHPCHNHHQQYRRWESLLAWLDPSSPLQLVLLLLLLALAHAAVGGGCYHYHSHHMLPLLRESLGLTRPLAFVSDRPPLPPPRTRSCCCRESNVSVGWVHDEKRNNHDRQHHDKPVGGCWAVEWKTVPNAQLLQSSLYLIMMLIIMTCLRMIIVMIIRIIDYHCHDDHDKQWQWCWR